MTIIYLGIAWMVGIALASVTNLPKELWSLGALISLIAAVVFRSKNSARIYLLMMGFLCLGAIRFTFAIPEIDDGHIASFNGQNPITMTGVITKAPVIRERSQDLRVQVESAELPDNTRKAVGGLVLVTVPPMPEVAYGSRIEATGQLEEPSSIGDFDFKQYLARQDIHSQMSWPEVEVISEGHGSIFYRAIYALKGRAQITINGLLPDPQAALLSGILLGNDKGIPPELADDFRTTGLTHIIAISGFNIAILAGLLLAVNRPILGHKRSAWFVIIGIITYTIFVGADAAVVRAAIMAAIFVIAARLMGRPTFAPAGLFTAALVMTLINPHILWDVGFQLSFAATLGLMLYVGPMGDWTSARLRPKIGSNNARKVTRMFSEILFATMAAILLTLPIILYHFEQLAIVSPVANLFVLPAQPGVMVWGGLATLTGMVVPAVGQLIAWVAWLFLSYSIDLVRFFASFPNAAVPMSLGPAGVVAFYALILGTTWIAFQNSERRADFASRMRRSLSWTASLFGRAILAVLINFWAFSQPDGDLHVAFLDIGQGDATFIQTPSGRQILIDGGAYPSVLKDQLGQQIPFWDKDIDLFIATHPDADHVAVTASIGRLRGLEWRGMVNAREEDK